jgi:hypothetical protein
MSKHLNLILNGKGGVGKSFLATNLVQFLKDQRIAHRAIDTDHENSTLKRFHPDCDFLAIDEPQELGELFTAVETNQVVVMDCRAASTDLLLDFFADVSGFDLLSQLGCELTILAPVNHEADSVEQMRLLTDGFGDRCRWVIVKNESHSERFRLYEGSRTRTRLVNELEAREIRMRRLHDWLVALLNEHGITITAACTHPAFSLVDRQRLKNWQKTFNQELQPVLEWLVGKPIATVNEPAKN